MAGGGSLSMRPEELTGLQEPYREEGMKGSPILCSRSTRWDPGPRGSLSIPWKSAWLGEHGLRGHHSLSLLSPQLGLPLPPCRAASLGSQGDFLGDEDHIKYREMKGNLLPAHPDL